MIGHGLRPIDSVSEYERSYAHEDLLLKVTESIMERLIGLGASRADLARALGTSRSHVTQLLSGNRNMTLNTLGDLGLVLHLDVAAFFNPTDSLTSWRPPEVAPNRPSVAVASNDFSVAA